MLPDDAARKTVIKALTDTENRLRVHQGLLLACLHDLKYPAGTDRNSWWLHHKEFFKSEHDPIVAASLTQGWLETLTESTRRRSAVYNHVAMSCGPLPATRFVGRA